MSRSNLIELCNNHGLWDKPGDPESALFSFSSEGGIRKYLLDSSDERMYKAMRATPIRGGVGRWIPDIDGKRYEKIISDELRPMSPFDERVYPFYQLSEVKIWKSEVILFTEDNYKNSERKEEWYLGIKSIHRNPMEKSSTL
jgi:hypothetical protein